MNTIALSLALILLSFNAHAKVFRNAYISFELPDSWKCNLEQTEWVCRSTQTKESKEAIIILTAKEVGPTDTFALYEAHLNSPIQSQVRGGGAGSKVVIKPKSYNINNQMWIDALHSSSEVPNYFTRYVATIKDKIAILVTFSAHKNYYTKYSKQFYDAILSMRVIASKNLLAKPEMGTFRPGSETLGGPIGSAMPSDMMSMDDEFMGKSKGGSKSIFLLLGALLLAVVGYIIYKRSKK